jgi:hypothetical protein
MGKGAKANADNGKDVLQNMSDSELRATAAYYNAGIADRVKKMVRGFFFPSKLLLCFLGLFVYNYNI